MRTLTVTLMTITHTFTDAGQSLRWTLMQTHSCSFSHSHPSRHTFTHTHTHHSSHTDTQADTHLDTLMLMTTFTLS